MVGLMTFEAKRSIHGLYTAFGCCAFDEAEQTPLDNIC